MNTYEDDIEDELARICETEHDMGPLDYCSNCQIRKEVVKCGLCDATFEGGKWWASAYTGDCDHMDDGVFDLFDDWGRRPVCPILEHHRAVGKTELGYTRRVCEACQTDWPCPPVAQAPGLKVRMCGDPITTPGATGCDFHQKWLDADECNRTYQRLVAVK